MFRAPRDHRVLDRAFLQVIEHLIAGDFPLTGDSKKFVEIVGIEIGNAPGADFSGADQLFERRHRLGAVLGARDEFRPATDEFAVEEEDV